ncbi:MAG: hypothetical protein U0792_23810 [Gemmataceae bacterium]
MAASNWPPRLSAAKRRFSPDFFYQPGDFDLAGFAAGVVEPRPRH